MKTRLFRIGREAEVFLYDLVATHFNHKGAHLFAGRRVPCPRRRMNREIDLIVLTMKMISLIEVKNWSGELLDRGSIWLQVRRGGDELRHPNLIDDGLEKRDAFLDYLRQQGLGQDSEFASRHVSHKVVFMNPNLTVSPSIRAYPDVITRDKLAAFLDRQPAAGFAQRIFSSVIEFCLGAETAGGLTGSIAKDRFALVKCVGDIRTWDRLRLFGGKVLTGDLYEMQRAGRRISRDQLATRGSVASAVARQMGTVQGTDGLRAPLAE